MTDAYDLAVALVARFNSADLANAAPIKAQAVATLVPEINRDISEATLHVQPWSEEEEPIDRGDMLSARRTLNVILQLPLQDNLTVELGRDWLKYLKESFRELTLDLGEGDEWRWVGNDTLVLFDTDAIKRKQYMSQFRPTFQNFG